MISHSGSRKLISFRLRTEKHIYPSALDTVYYCFVQFLCVCCLPLSSSQRPFAIGHLKKLLERLPPPQPPTPKFSLSKRTGGWVLTGWSRVLANALVHIAVTCVNYVACWHDITLTPSSLKSGLKLSYEANKYLSSKFRSTYSCWVVFLRKYIVCSASFIQFYPFCIAEWFVSFHNGRDYCKIVINIILEHGDIC